ncbi:MAG: LysR family transcriptional regulator, partial [Eggerthellales bacterium]|nr:LysR family transcriptional regulator [Eggerthellales bacterium]
MLDAYTWYTKLVEKRSFTKAAEELGVSQQTLSARLASLERELDAKLMVRGNPLSMTPAGMAFLVYAQEQQQAQQDMLRQIGEVTGGGCGVLKVGIAHSRG